MRVTRPARVILAEAMCFRGDHFSGGFGGTPGDGYGGRDVWGHWGTYYGPMVPTL